MEPQCVQLLAIAVRAHSDSTQPPTKFTLRLYLTCMLVLPCLVAPLVVNRQRFYLIDEIILIPLTLRM